MKKVWVLLISLFLLIPATQFAQGCMEGDSDEGVNVVGYIQPQFNYYFNGDDDLGNANKPSTFEFKRARVGFVGSIPYDVSYYVMAELSPTVGGPKLLDAFVTYAPLGKYAKFSIGQFKAPFGLEVNTACHKLHTINRSLVSEQLATPYRELGFMIGGGFGNEDRNFVDYKLAFLNGTGMNVSDDNANKGIAGRVVLSPLEMIKIGGSFRYATAGDIDSVGNQRSITRFAGDIQFEYGNFLLQGEYIFGQNYGKVASSGGCGKSTMDGDPLQYYYKNGFFVQALYMTPWYLQPVVKYEQFVIDTPGDNPYSYLGNSQTFDQSILTVGFNYFINEWTRLQVNYLYNMEAGNDAAGDPNEFNNDALLIQVQAVF